MTKPTILVSSCLLGQKVRFDGSGKPNKWLLQKLGPLVAYKQVCPEMAMGLGTPRETIRIVRDSDKGSLGLMTSRTNQDLTELGNKVVKHIVDSADQPDGIVLMSNSPMCGTSFVKVYESKNMIPHKDGKGFFAASLAERFPTTPIIEGYRLGDRLQREAFLSHLFSLHSLKREVRSVQSLQDFHRRHKFLFLSYNPSVYRLVRPLVASANGKNLAEVIDQYAVYLKRIFEKPRSSRHGTDALLHIYGFLKKCLSEPEKNQLLDAIEEYRLGLFDIALPLRMLSLLNAKIGNSYIRDQVIFSPFPKVLGF